MSEDREPSAARGVVEAASVLHRALQRRADADFEHPRPPEIHLAVLRLLRDRPGLTVRELAAELQLKPNNASAVITAMATAGMVRREPDATDRRVIHLHVTDQARARHDAVQVLYAGYTDAALATLSPAERDALGAAVPALLALAREIRAAGR